MYDQNTVKVFLYNWSEAVRSASRLQTSLGRLKENFPLSGEALKQPSDEILEKLDAFRVRYSDLQDCIGHKIFRGILLLEEESPGTMLDILNQMEKRRVIPSVEAWRSWREIRNAFAHDYPDSEQERAESLNAAWQAAPNIIGTLKAVAHYLDALHLDKGEL